METKHKFSFDKRATLGIVLTIVGFLLLSNNLGWFDNQLSDIIFSWPMLLIAIGLLQFSRTGKIGFGAILIVIGIYFLIPKLPWFDVPNNYPHLFWAIILVIVGLIFIFRAKKDHLCSCDAEKFSSDYIDDMNVFSGCEKKITTQTFRGGKVTSVFGGSNYDLLDSKLAEGKNVLDMVNIFGGSKLIVPGDWKIHVDVISIFGGITDKRRMVNISQDHETRELYITGVAIFGGGEIKSI
jgi:predicted membrane protein